MFGRNKKSQEFTISNNTILRIIGFGIATVLLVQFFENIIHPLTLIFVSFFLAMALNQAVHWVSKQLKSRNRVKATAIAYIAVMTVLIAFMALVVPPLVNQTREFISDVPQTVRDLKDDEGVVGDFVRRYELEQQVTEFANSWASDFSSVGGQAVSFASRIISNLISIITVLVLTFMMLIEGPRWMSALWKQVPVSKRSRSQKLAKKMYGVVTNYVNGQAVVAGIGAGFAIIALFIATAVFGVDSVNAIALGGLVFLFGLIPMFGATLAAIVVVFFSLFASVPLAITMAVYFIVYQQIENVTIQPYIQSKGNELTPMLVFIAAILGVGFGGVLGAFVAIPAAGCLKILIDDYLERKSELEKA
jgi:predicted PurR-regulated permease PerM